MIDKIINEIVDDFYTLALKYRTKKRLKEMLKKNIKMKNEI